MFFPFSPPDGFGLEKKKGESSFLPPSVSSFRLTCDDEAGVVIWIKRRDPDPGELLLLDVVTLLHGKKRKRKRKFDLRNQVDTGE